MAKPFTFDRVIRLIIALALITGAFWLIGTLKNVLLPFCLACLLAYIMDPFVEFNQRLFHTKGRVIPVFVTILDVTAIFALLVYLFLPTVMGEIHQMGEMITKYSTKQFRIPFIPDNVADTLEEKYNLSKLIAELESGRGMELLNKGETLVSSAVDFLMHSLEWLLTFIYIIFILIDYDKLGSGMQLLVPEKYKPSVFQVCRDIKDSMNKYFRSQLLIAFCAAVFYCIGFAIVGMPMAIVMGVLVGILYMIPYFQYVTLIPVAIICFITSLDGTVDFWVLLGKCGLVYVISQCICDYILTPKIMGKSLGLNPAIILLSLSIWGTLLGIIGMIIALPLTTLLLAYYKKVIIDHKPLSAPTGV
ncbi:MAG: AI-2E family transporter [Muribaculaceae bacterium]|nr:AI-2E family transporter [Muribaculaceae bacterium]